MAAQPVAAAAVAVAVVFALSPVELSGDVLDYSLTSNIKFYNKSIESLPTKFDLTGGALKTFLAEIKVRSKSTGWKDILAIPKDMQNVVDTWNLLTQYGQVSWDQVHAHVSSYVNIHSRASQDSMTLYLCLKNSLTKEAHTKMELFANQFTFGENESGVALLHLIIAQSYVDTPATTRLARENLSGLDGYITRVNSDIEKFNLYVREQVDALAARGETTDDLLANLFKAYVCASDIEFRAYIKQKEEAYDEGANHVNPTLLMQQALNKFKSLTEKGKWNKLSEADEKIIALETKLFKKMNKFTPVKKKGKDDVKTPKDKNKKKSGKFGKPSWVKDSPKAGDPKTKSHNGKDYHWCPKHEAWGIHKPEDCEGVGIKREDLKQNKDKPKEAKNKKTLRFAKALSSVAEEEDSESDE
jgi:hypothetical protein